MLILSIDTSGEIFSVALLENQIIRAEIFINAGLNHSLLLLPTIKHIYEITELTLAQTDLFVCTVGPGSFTGLRVGVCTMKGLAMATGKSIVGISTLEALAANAGSFNKNICPIIDAKRGQIFAAVYKTNENSLPHLVGDELLTDINLLLSSTNNNTLFLGSGAIKYSYIIRRTLPRSLFAPIHDCQIKAGIVGLLGLKKFQTGVKSDLLTLAPRYLHISESEKNLESME